jgi:hypothetical protein
MYKEQQPRYRCLLHLPATQERENVKRAHSVYEVNNPSFALRNLCLYALDYLQSKAKSVISRSVFNIDDILNQPGTRLVYSQNGAQIEKIC